LRLDGLGLERIVEMPVIFGDLFVFFECDW
jgi:hypothetical protein